MTSSWSFLTLIGLALGTGILVVFSGLPYRQRASFVDRIAPQLRQHALRTTVLADSAGSVTVGKTALDVLRPLVRRWAGQIVRRLPGDSAGNLEKRLIKSGTGKSVVDFRTEQVMTAAAGGGAGALVATIGWAHHVLPAVAGLLCIAAFGLCGFMMRDYLLTRTIAAREKRMLAEFPAIAELMALSVTAGESALSSLERVCCSSSGELTTEFSDVLSRARSGASISEALEGFAQRIGLVSLSRFVDGITVAIERGTPLADVLRSQAQDVRDQAKRELLEIAGKKEIAMMAPVVFLILPLTVIFAVFPGLAAIDIGL